MDSEFLRTLLRRSEGDTLDFKRDQYRFVSASDEDKAELLKDILAFANAWKESNAYIVIGVQEENGRAGGVVGATTELKDHEVQQFVNSKTNRPVSFALDLVELDGVQVTVVTIASKQARPLFLKRQFGRLRSNTVYVRRGSSTAEALPDEIADMGSSQATAAAQLQNPRMTLEFEHISDILRSEFNIPFRRQEPEEVHWLVVYARNEGGAVARIVQATVRIPEFVLADYGTQEPPETTAEVELAELDFSNWFSDPVHHHMIKRPPAYRHEILPGSRTRLGSEMTFPRDWIINAGCELLWTVQCDDMPATEGMTPYSEIPFVDHRK
jgi:hypothetical protein